MATFVVCTGNAALCIENVQREEDDQTGDRENGRNGGDGEEAACAIAEVTLAEAHVESGATICVEGLGATLLSIRWRSLEAHPLGGLNVPFILILHRLSTPTRGTRLNLHWRRAIRTGRSGVEFKLILAWERRGQEHFANISLPWLSYCQGTVFNCYVSNYFRVS